jgi:hypothetical protein
MDFLNFGVGGFGGAAGLQPPPLRGAPLLDCVLFSSVCRVKELVFDIPVFMSVCTIAGPVLM